MKRALISILTLNRSKAREQFVQETLTCMSGKILLRYIQRTYPILPEEAVKELATLMLTLLFNRAYNIITRSGVENE